MIACIQKFVILYNNGTGHIVSKSSGMLMNLWMLLQVMKIVHAIRMGWIKPSAKKETEKPNYYLLWNETGDADKDKKHRVHIPAPRMKLPG